MQFREIHKKIKTFDEIEMSILKGIISGDGDIGGRMSSSAKTMPLIREDRMKAVEYAAKLHLQNNTPIEELNALHLQK